MSNNINFHKGFRKGFNIQEEEQKNREKANKTKY